MFNIKDSATDKQEIIDEATELYKDIINSNESDRGSNTTVYLNRYKEILKRYEENYIERNSMLASFPDFLNRLKSEIDIDKILYFKGTTQTKLIELGLKTFLKNLKIPIPPPTSNINNSQKGTSPVQIINTQMQNLNNEINISNEFKIEINNYIKEFQEEINKSNPDESKLKKLLKNLSNKGKQAISYSAPVIFGEIIKNWDKIFYKS